MLDPESTPAPPPRPRARGGSPSPLVHVRRELPGARSAVGFGIASLVVGVLVIAGTYLTRERRVSALGEFIEELRAGGEEPADRIALTTFAVTLGVLAAVIVVEALVLRRARRSGRLRAAVAVPVLAAHATIAVLATAVLAPERQDVALTGGSLGAQFLLAAFAAVAVAVASRAERRP